MKLYRRGTGRNHGAHTILADRDEYFEWKSLRRVETERKKKKKVSKVEWRRRLCTTRIGVSIGKEGSHHDYTLELSLADFASMLDEVVDKAFRDSRKELAELMSSRIGKIQLLMMCANGYPPPEELFEEVDEEDKDL